MNSRRNRAGTYCVLCCLPRNTFLLRCISLHVFCGGLVMNPFPDSVCSITRRCGTRGLRMGRQGRFAGRRAHRKTGKPQACRHESYHSAKIFPPSHILPLITFVQNHSSIIKNSCLTISSNLINIEISSKYLLGTCRSSAHAKSRRLFYSIVPPPTTTSS